MIDAPLIIGLDHAQITIPLNSEDMAREFYCGLLGLREIRKPPELAGRGGFWLMAGAFQLHVGTEDLDQRPASKAHLAYQVDSIDKWKYRLLDAGLEITYGIQVSGFTRFEFRDPFGNRVEFLERF